MLLQPLSAPTLNWGVLTQLCQHYGLDAIRNSAGEDKQSIKAEAAIIENLYSNVKISGSDALSTGQRSLDIIYISYIFVGDLKVCADLASSNLLKTMLRELNRRDTLAILGGSLKSFKELTRLDFEEQETTLVVNKIKESMINDLGLKDLF